MGNNKIVFGDRVLIDLTGDTIKPEFLLEGETAHNNAGDSINGTIPRIWLRELIFESKDGQIQIPEGYHDGKGVVVLDYIARELLVPENIRNGISILGVLGSMEAMGEILAHGKSVEPLDQEQMVKPDAGYDYLNWVAVKPITFLEDLNDAGGITITIGRPG